ncbi:MAG: tetraspanin family protein [Lachnospiraceae bacterium]|nr:tetraspanin family protein [Lachnospiraceae bacterium]
MSKKNQHSTTEQKPDEELSYAELLRRREDEDRYLAEQRMSDEQKTGCLGISATFLVGSFCILFFIVGLAFLGFGIYNIFDGDPKGMGSTKNIIIMIAVGAVITVASIFVWRMFHRNLHNDE